MPVFRYRVWGRVQGVGYRSFVAKVAKRFGIRGFVRNLPSGDVEVVAQAPKEILDEFEKELKSYTSNGAYVEEIEKEPVGENVESEFEDFSIRF